MKSIARILARREARFTLSPETEEAESNKTDFGLESHLSDFRDSKPEGRKTGSVEAWIETRRREPSGNGTYFARTLCRARFSGIGLKRSERPSADRWFAVFDRDTSTSTFDDILSPISSTYMEGKCKL